MMNVRLLNGIKRMRRIWSKPQYGVPPSSFMQVAYFAPRQVVLITARHQAAENVWPIDWHMPLSMEPELYGISLNSNGFGTELVRLSKAFVLHFVPATWKETIFFCGRTSGREVDKFAATRLVTEEATSVNAPRLTEALGFIECQVEQILDVGDHILFVGRVTHKENRANAARLHHIDSGLEAANNPLE